MLQEERTFSDEEEEKLQTALGVAGSDLELIIETLEFVLQQVAPLFSLQVTQSTLYTTAGAFFIILDRQNMFLKMEMFYQLKLYLFGDMMDHITFFISSITSTHQQNCISCLSPYDMDVYSGK